jgi:lipid A 3-O-deacylase
VPVFAFESSAFAQTPVEFQPGSIFDELRIGFLAHQIEPAASNRGLDLNVELLFARPAFVYGNATADMVLRPRLHVGASINLDHDTNQVYAGFTWDVPIGDGLSLEVSFGGVLHDGPVNEVGRDSYGCALNFRESASIAYTMTDHWRLYGIVAHMSNAGLCDRNSGLTTAGMRLGYHFN